MLIVNITNREQLLTKAPPVAISIIEDAEREQFSSHTGIELSDSHAKLLRALEDFYDTK
jgi:hypothetical protein